MSFRRIILLLAISAAVVLSSCSEATIPARETSNMEPIAWGVYEGSFGDGVGTFHQPEGLVIGVGGELFVADVFNRRIQVFDETGRYLRQWTVDGWVRGIATDEMGNIYGAYAGSRVVKFDTYGNELLRWGGPGSAPGEFQTPNGIAIDKLAHRVYVPEENRIQIFTEDGAFLESWDYIRAAGIAVDGDGNLYITNNCQIQKLSSSGELLATWDLPSSDLWEFSCLRGIALDSDGKIYVTDPTASRLHIFDSNGVLLASWGKLGAGDGEFSQPSHVAVSEDGSVFVSDHRDNHSIQKFTDEGDFVFRLGKTHPPRGTFIWPANITTDSDGDVYVVDFHRVQKFDHNGVFVLAWGRLGDGSGCFAHPQGIASFDEKIFVVDEYNARVQVFDENGGFLTMWGEFGQDNGEFRRPSSIAIDSLGNVYVLDFQNHRIQCFSTDGEFVSSFNVMGFPHGIAVGSDESLYVSDRLKHSISKYSQQGELLLEWGSEGSAQGEFDGPTGVSTDPSGSVYIVDFENSRIQKFDQQGVFISTWGLEGHEIGKLYRPQGAAFWKEYVFVADSNNRRIQRIPASFWEEVGP